MNYQYNRQPGSYVDTGELRKRRKASFEALADKLAEFFGTNAFLAAFSRHSDLISYIVTGVSFFVSIVMCISGNISALISITVLVLGVIAISRKTILPLSIALSSVTLLRFIGLIASLMNIVVEIFRYHIGAGSMLLSLFNFFFALVELGVLGVLTALAWTYFAAVLPPRVYQPQPMYNGQVQSPMQQVTPQQVPPQQVPPQQTVQSAVPQQVPTQQASPQQAPPQQVSSQQAPPQQVSPQQVPPQQIPPQQVPHQQTPPQPQAAQDKVCPGCGTVNAPDSLFCRGCGTRLGV